MKLLEDKVALITGASSKIGSEVTKRFVKEGANVILISRSIENLNSLYNEIKELEEFKENSVTLIQLDLLDFDSVKVFANKLLTGSLDILIACAEALGSLSPIQDYELETFQNIINTNLIANWYLLKNLDPILKKSNAGRIIFVSLVPPSSYPCCGAYSASKAALEVIMKVYASETKHTKLCVNVLHLQADEAVSKLVEQAYESCNVSDDAVNKLVELASESYNVSGKVFSLT
ncbi:oxidoreductase [Wolbachia pipientis]|uniref:Oxidoreductase n=1 Tax=Wolbachia pipientis TaxID=955 RepID=A0A1E7QJP8_WOLPI|nr:SDR family oxidoreductase [Wolbachia pipientis]OEY86566.1 oxidoreductase [Wolbachia pipientis]